MDSRHLVFVYGTLMTGEPNHRLQAHAQRLGRASTESAFPLGDLGAFPPWSRGWDTGG